MQERYTKTETIGLGSNIINSLKGFVLGIILIIGSFIAIIINEYNSANFESTVNMMQSELTELKPLKENRTLDGKALYMIGEIKPLQKVVDTDFNISTDGIFLERKVYMYQWDEEQEKSKSSNLGGSTEVTTTYIYKKVWSSWRINSESFEKPLGHQNPQMKFLSQYFEQDAKMGDLIINSRYVREVKASHTMLFDANKSFKNGAKSYESFLYIGKDPNNPEIGDLKIIYKYAPSMVYTVIGTVYGENITPFKRGAKELIFFRESKHIAPQDILKEELDKNSKNSWIARLGALIAMFVGFNLLFGPIVAVANIIPILGSIGGFAGAIIAGVLTLIVGGGTIILSYLSVRPMFAIVLFIVTVVATYIMLKRRVK